MTSLPSPAALDTAEFRLVAAACAAAARGHSLIIVEEPVDPRAVLVLTERHRLAAPVLAMIAERLAPHDATTAATLKKRARHQRLLALDQARHTVALSAALDRSGIPHLVVKGAVLSQQLYGDVAARSSKDIDILVDPDRFADAEEVLRGYGLSRTDEGVPRKHRSYAAGAIEVELHGRLVNLPSIAPLDFRALWSRRSTVALLDHGIPVPGDVDTFLYLCAHGAGHAWFRLKWLQDIGRIVVRDRAGIVVVTSEAAQAAGIDRVFAAMLRLVDTLLGIGAAIPVRADAATGRAVALAQAALAAPAALAHAPTAAWVVRRSLVQLGVHRSWRYRRDLLVDLATGTRSFDHPRDRRWSVFHLPGRAVRFWRTRR